MNRFIVSRTVLLFVAALLLSGSGNQTNTDPVGDFFKRVGHSISKAFQPSPTPRPTRKTGTSQRVGTQQLSAPQPAPSATEEPSKPPKEEKFTPIVRRAIPAPPEKAKEDLPFGLPVPGQKGMVTSPYTPEGGYIDVSGFSPGTAVKDPYTGRIFLVP